MRRLAVGITFVVVGLSAHSFACAQAEAPAETPSAWSWLLPRSGNPKKSAAAVTPPKPSADQAPVGTSAAGSAGSPHVLRQTTCNIPFTIDTSKSAPGELQLYVSSDRGTNWRFFAKASPAAGHFTYRAPADGEYWFALRSVEKGTANPDVKKLKPGLRVIFDTKEPELRFDANLSDTGEISATWQASDATLNAESLKVEYQSSARAPWQLVPVPSSRPERDGLLAGQHRWIPVELSDALLVRVEVTDRAGNKSVMSRRLTSRQVAAGQPADGFRPRSPSSTTYPVAHGGQSWPADNRVPPPQQVATVAPHGELPPPKPSVENTPPVVAAQPVRNPFVYAKQPLPEGYSLPPRSGSVPQLSTNQAVPERNPATTREEEITPVGEPTSPGGASQSSVLRDSAGGEAHPATGSEAGVSLQQSVTVPTGERPRMTNSRQFTLDYEIDSLGLNGVARVELWGTADGGRTWKHWQNDLDQTSPLDVTVEKDGIYGFRIVIIGSNQLSTAPPQPGDPADLWAGVDTSVPTARLTSAIYGEGEHAGQLDIRWQATDIWFTDRPVSLYFSEHPQGPWTTIAAGLPNTGQYFWAVEPRIPRSIYLRIEARDEAGNVAEHQIQDAISTAGLIPQGRIRGLRLNTTPPANDRSATREIGPR